MKTKYVLTEITPTIIALSKNFLIRHWTQWRDKYLRKKKEPPIDAAIPIYELMEYLEAETEKEVARIHISNILAALANQGDIVVGRTMGKVQLDNKNLFHDLWIPFYTIPNLLPPITDSNR